MGLSASQGRLLLLTAKQSDLEFRAQEISQQRLTLAAQLEKISQEYEDDVSNRDMIIKCQGAEESTAPYFNLTYASLVSGLIYSAQNSDTFSAVGLQASAEAGTQDFIDSGYHTAAMYRLQDYDGNIVISSLEEIPGVTSEEAELLEAGTEVDGTQTKSEEHDDATIYSVGTLPSGVKNSTTVKRSEFGKLEDDEYFVSTSGGLTKDINKAAPIGAGDSTNTDGTPDYTYQIVKLSGGKSTEDIKDGDIKLTEKTATYGTLSTEDVKVKKGKGNTYVCGDITYVLDKNLAVAHDGASTTSGSPNYMQECLRNGLYTIQQYTENANNEGTYKWNNVSWDGLTTITDEAYDDDDDAAAAKYKRLQQQIQTQDKKLEMELDDIETQRTAVSTEQESVQKVIQDNEEKTFKTFA